VIDRIAKVEALASELLGDEAIEWLNRENDYFFGYSPIQMILLGQDDAVIETLEERLGNGGH
jgi:hypothetical protein